MSLMMAFRSIPGAWRPRPSGDKGYDNLTRHAGVEAFGYTGHVRPIGEKPIASEERTDPPRRWVVEACLSWLKPVARPVGALRKASNYLGGIQLACGLLWYRRLWKLKTAIESAETEF
jgi:putative transposase